MSTHDDDTFGKQYTEDEVYTLILEAIGEAQASAFSGSKLVKGMTPDAYIRDLLDLEDEDLEVSE